MISWKCCMASSLLRRRCGILDCDAGLHSGSLNLASITTIDSGDAKLAMRTQVIPPSPLSSPQKGREGETA